MNLRIWDYRSNSLTINQQKKEAAKITFLSLILLYCFLGFNLILIQKIKKGKCSHCYQYFINNNEQSDQFCKIHICFI